MAIRASKIRKVFEGECEIGRWAVARVSETVWQKFQTVRLATEKSDSQPLHQPPPHLYLSQN